MHGQQKGKSVSGNCYLPFEGTKRSSQQNSEHIALGEGWPTRALGQRTQPTTASCSGIHILFPLSLVSDLWWLPPAPTLVDTNQKSDSKRNWLMPDQPVGPEQGKEDMSGLVTVQHILQRWFYELLEAKAGRRRYRMKTSFLPCTEMFFLLHLLQECRRVPWSVNAAAEISLA